MVEEEVEVQTGSTWEFRPLFWNRLPPQFLRHPLIPRGSVGRAMEILLQVVLHILQHPPTPCPRIFVTE